MEYYRNWNYVGKFEIGITSIVVLVNKGDNIKILR